ncbi:cold-shock protein, partial [Yersinia enterocolitica]|nr:cold-shock protein [Yersinia enterocolitica]EKN5049210.1 cold-shock protein [Yersinia enterocolitica]EKN5059655.1 cold-shock protein [Yersinia enterocolitica]EKN5080520.1 cold-shock protein [Yersinia enterocolitica]EKN5973235.1 cold-shock protein [Yersinia enterocolitica]
MPHKLCPSLFARLWRQSKIIEGSISMSNKMTGLVKWFNA